PRAGPGRALPRAPPGPYRQPGGCAAGKRRWIYSNIYSASCPLVWTCVRTYWPGPTKPGRRGAVPGGRNLAYATPVRSRPRLRELSAEQFTAELDALTQIYALAMDAPAAELPGRMAIMERHAGYPAFRAVVAAIPAGPDAGPDPRPGPG